MLGFVSWVEEARLLFEFGGGTNDIPFVVLRKQYIDGTGRAASVLSRSTWTGTIAKKGIMRQGIRTMHGVWLRCSEGQRADLGLVRFPCRPNGAGTG